MGQVQLRQLDTYQAELLARLFLHPDKSFALIELAVDVGMPTWAVDAEMQPLVASGLVNRSPGDSADAYQANAGHSAATGLTRLVAATHGPIRVVREEFAAVVEANLVLIFGDWAEVSAGQHAPSPRDVDVLIVGSPSAIAVADAEERAEQRLDLPVNTDVRSGEEWALGAEPLVAHVQGSEYVTVLPRGR